MIDHSTLTFAKRPITAAVVVDSRNVRGQVSDLFGHPRHVSVAGVISMLELYGFEVTEVFVGIATTGPSSATGALEQAVKRNLRYAAEVDAHPAGVVLHGRLVERRVESGTKLEEKLVDVRCAVQVARLSQQIKDGQRQGVIVVLSEDMDLIPAYEYARELHVPVFAAANDTVSARAESSRWLLLTETALVTAAGRGYGRDHGTALRRRLVRMLTAPDPRPLNFKVVREGTGGVQATHNSGARALWTDAPGRPRPQMGDIRPLYIAGVDWPDGSFPRLLVTSARPSSGPGGLHVATVLRHQTPTRVEVALDQGGHRTLSGVSPGSLLPGMAVLVHVTKHGRQKAWRLVGPVDGRPASPHWDDPMTPAIVRATTAGSAPGARVRALVVRSGQEVTLQPPSEDRVVIGSEYAAVPAMHTDVPGGTHVVAVAVSSRMR